MYAGQVPGVEWEMEPAYADPSSSCARRCWIAWIACHGHSVRLAIASELRTAAVPDRLWSAWRR
jgi:hypothetical protein